MTTHLRLVEPVPTTGWKTVAPNIQHTPGGGYRVRQRVGKKRITLGVFATFAEALAVQAASIEEVRSRGLSKRPTLETWMPTWFDRREKSDVRSVDSERNRASKHVYGTKLARIPLDEIRRADILAWLRELEAKHVDYEGQRVGWARKKAAQDKANGKTPKRRARRSASTRTTNRVGNHISGEMTERAVEFWLKAQNVRAIRPADLREEITKKMPDITAGPVKIDVKSTLFLPDFNFPVKQLKPDADIAIVWCKPDRSGGMTSEEYNSRVPTVAVIYGWATMADVGAGDVSGDDHLLPKRKLRPLADLLTWITTGACPPPP